MLLVTMPRTAPPRREQPDRIKAEQQKSCANEQTCVASCWRPALTTLGEAVPCALHSAAQDEGDLPPPLS